MEQIETCTSVWQVARGHTSRCGHTHMYLMRVRHDKVSACLLLVACAGIEPVQCIFDAAAPLGWDGYEGVCLAGAGGVGGCLIGSLMVDTVLLLDVQRPELLPAHE